MIAALLFFLVLGVLVVVHELGHFWAARWSGIKVTEFGVGLPPKAYGYKPTDSEVEYSLNWLPIGGFVKIYGEDYESIDQTDPDYDRSFVRAKKYQQIITLVAGVMMNFVAAIILFAMAGWSGSLVPTDTVSDREGFYVVAVAPDSPAATAGLVSGNKVVGISDPTAGATSSVSENGLNNKSFSDFISGSNAVELILEGDDGATETVLIKPESGVIASAPEQKAIGVYADSLALEKQGLAEGLVSGVRQSAIGLAAVTVGFWDLLVQVVSGNAGETLQNLSGPVGIAQMSEQALSIGLGSLFSFAAFLSLNLVVLNLLPFPALDGGRIVFVIIEAIKGSPINPKVSGYANLIGFGLLLLLMLVVTVQDIVRIF